MRTVDSCDHVDIFPRLEGEFCDDVKNESVVQRRCVSSLHTTKDRLPWAETLASHDLPDITTQNRHVSPGQ